MKSSDALNMVRHSETSLIFIDICYMGSDMSILVHLLHIKKVVVCLKIRLLLLIAGQ
jgi:hypothetical protein